MTTTTALAAEKHFSTSIQLWIRQDEPRQKGMDHWSGPHSGIISATPGMLEYRQVHLDEQNPGRWPAIDGVQTSIPKDRRIDGIAEVTQKSAISPLVGRAQTRKAWADEVNVFRRTLLYGGLPGWSRWWDVGSDGTAVGSRTVLYLRRRDGVGATALRKFVHGHLAPAIAAEDTVQELRTQDFIPWNAKLWDTPNVAHDNPVDQQMHEQLIIGFSTEAAREKFYVGDTARTLSTALTPLVSALHAYDVTKTLTYVEGGTILNHPHQ